VGSQVPDRTRSSAPSGKPPVSIPSFCKWVTNSATSTAGRPGRDYDGSRTAFDSSTNYSLAEYARDIVWNIMEVCDSEKVAASGDRHGKRRAIVAHHCAHRRGLRSIEKGPHPIQIEIREDDPSRHRSPRNPAHLTQQNRMNRCTTRSR